MSDFSPYNLKLKTRNFPSSIPAYIEVAKGSRFKYEWDNEIHSLVLDRVLHSSVVYPYNYGFFPQTLCDDGDPLDVLVMCDGELLPDLGKDFSYDNEVFSIEDIEELSEIMDLYLDQNEKHIYL